MWYPLICLTEPVFIAVSKLLLTGFGIYYRSESCERLFVNRARLFAQSIQATELVPITLNQIGGSLTDEEISWLPSKGNPCHPFNPLQVNRGWFACSTLVKKVSQKMNEK